MVYAGFWRRNIALTIDTVIFCCVVFALDSMISYNFFILNLFYQAICLLYFVGLTASPKQGTIGQGVMKIKVGDLYGEVLSPLQSLIRYIAWGLPFWPLVLYTSMPSTDAMLAKFDAISTNPELIEGLLKTPETDAYMQMLGLTGVIMFVGSLIWYLPILFTKEKTGIHDLVCKQRVFKEDT
ncbi:MAG: RDD family protein [Alphaproteobacteria bacterium]|nr:RDD family protein [Alphaproteobacteria bacterium]